MCDVCACAVCVRTHAMHERVRESERDGVFGFVFSFLCAACAVNIASVRAQVRVRDTKTSNEGTYSAIGGSGHAGQASR